MREFDLVVPKDLTGALEALAGNDTAVQPLAGGTDMIVNVRSQAVRPQRLVALSEIGDLARIGRQNGHVRVGSGVAVARFLNEPLLTQHADLVRQAAANFANPMIRNLATVGGNLASASPAADLAPPLLALAAEVELTGKSGIRVIPLEDFFIGPRKTARRPDELITALRWQVPPAKSAGAFYKLGLRQADAISVVSVAVQLEREGERCVAARIALGAVAARPMRAHRAEALLAGQSVTGAAIEEAARMASEECSPIDDLRGTADYRRRMVRVYVRRMLEKAWEDSRRG